MSHDYHQGQPGYSAAQLLADGCAECQQRSKDLRLAISHMDVPTWQRAWARAIQYGQQGLTDMSTAELPLLALLWQLCVTFDARSLPDALFDWLNEQARIRLALDLNHAPGCGCGYHYGQRPQAQESEQS